MLAVITVNSKETGRKLSGPLISGEKGIVLTAIREIRESVDIQVIRSEFLKILQTVESAHAVLIRQALSDGMETESYRRLKRTHQNLEWELEDEKKRA